MEALSPAVCCLLGICLSPCAPGTVLWLDVEQKRLAFVFTHSNQRASHRKNKHPEGNAGDQPLR